MTLLTSTALTEGARSKAAEATGVDPGPYLYRLHKDTCDRVSPKDSPREIDSAERVAQYAPQIAYSKPCTRCNPKDYDTLVAQANGALEAQAARAQQEEPQEQEQQEEAPKARRQRSNAKVGYSTPEGDTMVCTGHLHPDGETLPVKKFPTVTGVPGARANECRKCRDSRRTPAPAAE